MTQLKRPLRREVSVGGIRRPLVIHLDPEAQRVGVSEKGCKKVYWMRLQTLYALAIRAEERRPNKDNPA